MSLNYAKGNQRLKPFTVNPVGILEYVPLPRRKLTFQEERKNSKKKATMPKRRSFFPFSIPAFLLEVVFQPSHRVNSEGFLHLSSGHFGDKLSVFY